MSVLSLDRLVVFHKNSAGAGELHLAPDISIIQDYVQFPAVDGTSLTETWLNANTYVWWRLNQSFDHGNYTWDPITQSNPVPSSLRSSTTPYRLVQFGGPLLPAWVNRVGQLGTFVGVSANQTVVANLSATAQTTLESEYPVWVTERFHPGLKLPPRIEQVTGVRT